MLFLLSLITIILSRLQSIVNHTKDAERRKGNQKMNGTKTSNTPGATRLLVGVNELQEMLSCGIVTAKKIATEADASIKIGKRRLYNVEKIRAYLAEMQVIND